MNVFEIFAKIGLDTSEYEKGLNDSESDAQSFGSKLKSGLGTAGKIAGGALAAVGTAAIGAGTAFIKGAGNLAEYGDNIDKMSQKMGMSAEAYQEWDAILQHSGTSIEAMKNGMMTLTKQAEAGNAAFETLGISQEELANMNQEELFARTIEGLQGMEDASQRTVLASQLLGGGAKQLGALLNTSAEDTEAMRQRVHELGGVMSDDAVKASAAFQDSLQDMKTSIAGIGRGVVADFLPSVTKVMDGLTKIFAGEDGGVKILTDGITDLIEHIKGAIPQIMEAGSAIIQALFQALIDNLPQIVEGGTELIIQLVVGITNALPQLIPAIIQAVGVIIKTLWENLPQILSAVGQAVVDVGKQIWDSMKSIDWWSIGSNIIEGIKGGLLDMGRNLVNAAIQVVADAWNGMKNWLGIASPSKKARDILGKNWALGIGKGFEENMPVDDMVDAVDDAFNEVGNAMAIPDFTDTTSYSVDTGNPRGTFAPVLNIYGAEGQGIHELAEIIMDELTFMYNQEGAAYGIA